MNELIRIHILIPYMKVKEAFNVKTFKQCHEKLAEEYGDFLDSISVRTSGMIVWDDSIDYRCHRYGIDYTLNVRNEGDLERIKNQMWEVLEEADILENWLDKCFNHERRSCNV